MEEATDPRRLWAATRLHVWPDRYVLVSFPVEAIREAAELVSAGPGFGALVRERDEVSVTVEEAAWTKSSLRGRARASTGPLRAVTFDIDLPLSVCGYLAPAAERLGKAGISIVPQCGFLKDHLLVGERDLAKALLVLEDWIADCQK
jgi:hypothetical protein